MTNRNALFRILVDTDINIAPSDSNKTSSSSSSSYNKSDANFDSNMVIILAALLCALICALGLNSIVRCIIRCSRRFGFQTAEETAAASTGLKKETLSRIPVVVYKSGLHIPATDCPICIGEFKEGENVRILPRCNHGFHVKCIDKWLVLQSSCPTCRRPLFEHSANSNA